MEECIYYKLFIHAHHFFLSSALVIEFKMTSLPFFSNSHEITTIKKTQQANQFLMGKNQVLLYIFLFHKPFPWEMSHNGEAMNRRIFHFMLTLSYSKALLE